jgi:pre-mRNA-splicing factor SYF1
MSYVLGKFVQKRRAGGKKKLPEMKDALEDEKEDLEEWEGGLDPIVGYEEWRLLVATFERALMWIPNVRHNFSLFARPLNNDLLQLPRLWLLYLSIFSHPKCPGVFSHTHARRTYDRALRTLPPSLHSRIWVRYLLWAEARGGSTTVAVYRRYLAVDPSITERYVDILLAPTNPKPRPLEAAKLLLSLARKAAKGEYTSPEGKSPYQLLGDWLDVVEKYPEHVGIGVDETVHNAEEREKADATEAAEAEARAKQEPASLNGALMRIAGPAVPVAADGKPLPAYDEDVDAISPRKLDIERIVRKDGLEVYKDQAGRLWTGLATYWIKRGEFDRAKLTFESGIASALTIRDFTQIFDAYAEFSESLVSALMEALADPDEDDDEEDTKETEAELDERMKAFEELMDRRPFLVNDVLLRRNPNDVQEWEKRVALWGNDDEKAGL